MENVESRANAGEFQVHFTKPPGREAAIANLHGSIIDRPLHPLHATGQGQRLALLHAPPVGLKDLRQVEHQRVCANGGSVHIHQVHRGKVSR